MTLPTFYNCFRWGAVHHEKSLPLSPSSGSTVQMITICLLLCVKHCTKRTVAYIWHTPVILQQVAHIYCCACIQISIAVKRVKQYTTAHTGQDRVGSFTVDGGHCALEYYYYVYMYMSAVLDPILKYYYCLVL